MCFVSTLSVLLCIDNDRGQYIWDAARLYRISRESCDTYTSTQTIGLTLHQGRPKVLSALLQSDPRRTQITRARTSNAANRVLLRVAHLQATLSTRGLLVVPWGRPEKGLVTALEIGRRKSLANYIVFENPAISKGIHMYCTFNHSEGLHRSFLWFVPVRRISSIDQSFRAGVGEEGV